MARVLVGLSGGVDSSVAAALLAREGHDVIGISLQLYDRSHGGAASRCCSPEDFLDARRVAEQVGFPYYVINEEASFSRHVLDPFVEEYAAGRTPNPCVGCNTRVKFSALARLARDLGASAVATGHFARLDPGPSGGRRLMRGVDRDKDQSYFLFDLTADQRAIALFPLGDSTKQQVRSEAESLGLATAGKPESQDVCFLEKGDYRRFVRERMAASGRAEPPGELVTAGGRVLGRHEGVSGYTVGQRRGLGVSSGRRLYVIAVEAPANRVVLGEEQELLSEAIDLDGVRMDDGLAADRRPFEATVQIRYRHAGARALVRPGSGGAARVEFCEAQRSVSPGQAAVFYDEDVVLGGGWIRRVHPA